MQILTTPHPFLKHTARPLASWDKKTAQEVREMETILKKTTNPKGVGLAATQVGLDKRLFILLDEERNKVNVFVNPEIIRMSQKMLSTFYKKKKDRWLEGCLSIPRLWGFVNRAYSITLKYQEADTLKTITKDFSDVIAAYIQHEVDHLNGILFTDRIRQQNGLILRETADGLSPIIL